MPHRSPADQYLQKVGNVYYARVKVPRTLAKAVGQTHLRKSLKTDSKATANLRKHAVVAAIKAELAKLARSPGASAANLDDAFDFRVHLLALDGEERADLELVAHTHAEYLEEKHGAEHAGRWYRAATREKGDTLAELVGKWLDVSDYKASTNAGHRLALRSVLDFMRNPHAMPGDITRAEAIRYVDTDLTQKGLAYNTIRDRLVSLGGLWSWLETRNIVAPGSNPWTGHKVSKARNVGTRLPKRKGGFTNDELRALLHGPSDPLRNAKVRRWPTFAYLPDLVTLGMFTGARLESLCALQAGAVTLTDEGAALLTIANDSDKNESGNRLIGVVDAGAVGVLKRRCKDRKPGEHLFAELSPGGEDDKMSASAIKAFTRYRRECGVTDGADFHSFRRRVVDVLEQAGASQVAIARYVGHKVGTMAGDVYASGSSNKANTLATARLVRYELDSVLT